MRALMIAAVIAAAAVPRSSSAAPAEELAMARAGFRAGDCVSAMPTLNLLLYPQPRLALVGDLVEAHVLLGACFLGSGDGVRAAREFEEALSLEPTMTLDPLLFSAEAIQLFTQTKEALEVRSRREAEARALADERERLRRYRESLIVYEVRPYYVNFIPFGAGQLQNGQRGKGIFFASSQVATGAASMGIWVYLVGKYGLGGQVPEEDAGTVRRLQQIEIATGAACLGLMAWGIVDSLIHHRPRVQVEGDDSLLPKDLRKLDRARPAASRLRLHPTLMPDGAGVALSWEH
jgi:hypothetical protein